jgi:ABC-type Mn2+/Zn2+ transport system permease subunit
MITRQMALVGDALGHVALPGMGIALIAGADPSIGAFGFLAIGILAIWRLGERSRLSLETLVGIVFVTSLALGFLIIPKPELLESLVGDLSRMTFGAALFSVLLSALTILLVHRIYPGMMLLGISEDLAAVEGVRTAAFNFIYLTAIALMVSVGVKVTGSLLVGALVIVPPATARLLSGNLTQYARASAFVGGMSCFVGIWLSRLARFAPGPSIILVSAACFLAALLLKSARRFLRGSPPSA